MEKIICSHCKEAIEGKPKRTFLGFQRYTCESCKKPTVYPLTSGYRAIYWVAIVVFALGSLMALQQGNVLIPSILLIAAIVALIKDKSIQKKIIANKI
jgi:hypothetical protein